MPYHVYMFQYRVGSSGTGDPFYFVNLTREHLETRIIAPWDAGRSVTYDGRTADSKRSTIKVFETREPIPTDTPQGEVLTAMQSGADVTNDWILGAAGHGVSSVPVSGETAAAPLKDPGRVMVVHGRNLRLRTAIFTFLRALGLRPIEWEDAIAATGMASPHNLAAVRAAMDVAQTVVVLLTAEDRAGLIPELADSADSAETDLAGQPRQNVILEAGMAMGVEPSRTILVQVGDIRGASDFDGLNVVRLTNDAERRGALRRRLMEAGCTVDDAGTDWLSPAAGGDFNQAVLI